MGDVLGGSLSTDKNGRTTLTGAGSNINFGEQIDKIIEAKRQPAVRLENRIAENQAKVDALNELQSRLSTLEEAAGKLRGRPSFDNAGDVFEQKEGFFTASRDDSQTPSTATSLLVANVENSAAPQSYDLEVLQTAEAQKVASTTDIGDAGIALDDAANLGGTFTGGEFTIGTDGNTQTVSVSATDSLLDLRDKINAANSGDNASGVSASVITVSDSKSVLQLTADDAGREISLADTTNSPLQDLGVIDGAGNLQNELQAPQNAIFNVDGLSDGSVYTTNSVDDATANLTTVNSVNSSDGGNTVTLEIADDVSGDTETISFDPAATSLQDVADQIDATGVAEARIVEDGSQFRLELNSASGDSITVTETSATSFATEAGIAEQNSVTRQTNTVDDLIKGVTLDLFKAERGTNVQFDVEIDQDAANEAINQFVEAYNSVKQFVNAQQQGRALEGQDPNAENSIVGALEGEAILRDVEQDINQIISGGATNVDTAFEVLGQIGIDFVDNDDLSDPTLEDTLTIDQSELNDKLLNDFPDLRNLFRFNFEADSSGLTMLSYDEQTGAGNGTLTVDTDASGNIISASLDNGTIVETSDNILEVQDGPMAGLVISANLGDNLTGKTINLSTSTGVGSEAFYTADKLGNSQARDGVVQSEIDRLIGRDSPDIKGQNERYQEEIDRIDRRLESERERLLRQYTAMEEALIELESAQKRLAQFAQAGSGND